MLFHDVDFGCRVQGAGCRVQPLIISKGGEGVMALEQMCGADYE